MIKVVNVKVKHIRPKYKNLKEWMDDSDNVYIGRRGIVFVDGVRFPKRDSIWANPFKISESVGREDVIQKYREYIREKITDEDLSILRSAKRIGCWCAPLECHGDVLLEILAEGTTIR